MPSIRKVEEMVEHMGNNLIDCLSKQLSELELFQSMYSNDSELSITDTKVIEEIKSFVNCGSEYTPPHLDFVLKIIINEIKLEICVNLPSFYPDDKPDVNIRSNQLNRHQESELNSNLINYIETIPRGEACLLTIVSWIQDQIANIKSDVKVAPDLMEFKDEKFARYWIFSHHIYNKKKRSAIIENAKELNLNGFCLPGKPGIICIEGDESNCKEWWRIIKALTWQKIMLKETELFNSDERTLRQKFNKFEEIHFQSSNRNSKHMNMGDFFKYMEQLGLSNTFNNIFGLGNDDS